MDTKQSYVRAFSPGRWDGTRQQTDIGSGLTVQKYYARHLLPGLGRYVFIWLVVGIIFGVAQCLVPELRLIRSRASLLLVGQVLAPTATAILVLILASVFVVAQVSISLYGSRAGLVLISDLMILGLVARGLLVVSVGLLCLVLAPAAGVVGGAAYAIFATVLLAAIGLVVQSPITLSTVFNAYTAPRLYATTLIDKVRYEVGAAADSVAGFKVPALGEMLRSGLRRGDSVAVSAAVEGMASLGAWWIAHVEKTPSARRLRLPSTETRPGWLVRDLGDALVRAVDEGLRSAAPHTEVDRLIDALEVLCRECFLRGLDDEARTLMEQLAEVGTTTHQVVGPQTVSLLPRPAAALTSLEAAAEDSGRLDFAAHALALWNLVVTWMWTQYGHVHPMLYTTPQNFGPSPRWEQAEEILESRNFQENWVNQLHDPQALARTLRTARKLHAGEPLEVDETQNTGASTRLAALLSRLARFLSGGYLRGGPEAAIPRVAGVPPPPAP